MRWNMPGTSHSAMKMLMSKEEAFQRSAEAITGPISRIISKNGMQWFGDSTGLRLLDSQGYEVGDRLHVSYRLTGIENGEAYVVEQHLFCVLAGGVIERAHLLCSGFRPRERD